MNITIARTELGYVARVTSAKTGQGAWVTPTAMELDELIAELRKLGCHQTDIGDAFYAADPHWVEREGPAA